MGENQESRWQRVLRALSLTNYRKFGIFLGIALMLYSLMYHAPLVHGLLVDALGGVGDAASQLAEGIRELVNG